MARCDEGYLCEVCGADVAAITDSDLYLRFVLGEVPLEALHLLPERHIACNPGLAQYIVDPKFPEISSPGPFDKSALDCEYVAQEEARVTRAWRRLQQIPTLGLAVPEYPLSVTPEGEPMMRLCVPVLLASLLVSTARADVDSGPKAGEKVAALKVFGVVGTVEGKDADFAADRKDSPTLYLFVQSEHWDRPMARFLKTLDEKLGEVEKAAAVAVWLGEKKSDEHKQYLPRAQMSLSFARTDLTVFDGDKGGPEGWGINTDARLTVVIVNKGKVVKSIGFVSVNETDVKGVIETLK